MELNPNLDVWGKDVPLWERGQHGGRTRPLNQEAMFKNLVDVKSVFDRHGVTFALSHGTMLGVYRDGNFIPWDDDVDIALFLADKPRVNEAAKELKAMGFFIPPEGDPKKPICPTGPNENMPWYDFVAIRDGEKIEGWFFEKKGDFFIYDEPRSKSDLKHPKKFYEPLADYEWKGHVWKIPNHIEEYLVMMYGHGWKTPNENRKYNRQRYDSRNRIVTNFDREE